MMRLLRRWWRRTDQTEIEAFADAIVGELEELEASGEWKRHQAYARLIRTFPDLPRNEIGLAIELAVRRLRRW